MQDAVLKKQLIRWEVISVCWIILVGGFMHSVYKLSGYWPPVALIAPVNESIWEHQKMFFWPGLFITVVQYLFMRQRVANFWFAKLVLLTLTPMLAVTSFVIYVTIAEAMGSLATAGPTALLATVCAVIGQIVCCRIIISENYPVGSSPIIPVGYLLLILSFSSFTYFPPKFYLFEHFDNYQPAGQYGLDADREQSGRTHEN